MIAPLGMSLRMLRRDWRAGELRILGAALVIAVAAVTSVGFFADRVAAALVRDAHQLLGADLVVVSDHPFGSDLRRLFEARAPQRAEALNFISMAIAGDKSQLAGVKAVTENYPLRGRLRIAPAPGAPDAAAPPGPPRGEVWIEERLVAALGTPVGARLKLGSAELTVGAVLTLEPERGANFFNLAPRLVMNAADVPATGLVQTGSRVSYYLYAAGPADAIHVLENEVRPRLERGQRLDTLESGRQEVRASIERAQRFLALTALLSAILAGVAVALAARRFVERHLDGCAVMRCLGASQARILALYMGEFLLLALAACALGTALGLAAQQAIASALGELLRAELPAPSLLPGVQGFLLGFVLLLGFALPPLLRLKDVPAVRVIRREAAAAPAGVLGAYAAGLVTLAALLVWQAGDVKLGLYVAGGFAGALLVFFAAAWALLNGLGALRRLRPLRRRAFSNTLQTASLALGLTALLLLTFTRNDLVQAWRRSAPPDAPNRFLLGVQPEQLGQIKGFLEEKRFEAPTFYPMVRGRVTAKNGEPVSAADYPEERARRLVEREFNLSYMDAPPAHNVLSAGRWFRDANELSVEEGIARTLGWRLGDELAFAVAGETFRARITSLRALRWDSMRVNFFVIAPPGLLKGLPTSFISAFRVAPGQEPVMNELVARFPNLTLVDVSAALRQAREVVDQLVNAVQLVFVFALAAGVLVLYCALLATEDERRREAALMRVYGAARRQVAASQGAEFLAMGLVAGALATLGAALIGELLARRVFDLDLAPSLGLWLCGPLAGLALLSLNAWLSSRSVLRASPALTLRDSV
ncbi:MAG TPA: FtsX-like permease family protein [Burkholderiales bacterium]|nr:FtsX-like permease family protein [Burkholderiales bacterium]